MKFIVKEDYEEVSKAAAEIFIKSIQDNPKITLCLATGSTPLGLYGELINSYNKGIIDFSEVKSFNLDEYVGLTPEHHGSYKFFMENNLFNHINIKKENYQVPSGIENDYDMYCYEYEKMIEKTGGIDLLLLGVGENGHIAFNEPGTKVDSITHVVNLTEETIKVNSRFFEKIEEVPKEAITMGMGSIMKAKKIVLLATGARKSPVIDRLVNEQDITVEFPISILKEHSNVTVIIDKEALGDVRLDK